MTSDKWPTINVTKAEQPDRQKYHEYVDNILDSGWLTNRGQYVCELENQLSQYLGVKQVILVSNATLGIQIAAKALQLNGEVISTPFTFIATGSAVVWEGLDIKFADIDAHTFNISVPEIEKKITENTSAIMPVHVYGSPCDVEGIDQLANKYNLKVIYDAAHAFGVRHGGRSLLDYGDVSVVSFHATKLFHTIEGGAIITDDFALGKKVRDIINFGITGPESITCLGINAKMNEFEAAMGLCLLEKMSLVIAKRKALSEIYDHKLNGLVVKQKWAPDSDNNYSYYPVLLQSESQVLKAQQRLNSINVFPRRYFFPTIDTLDFINVSQQQIAPIAFDISRRILCLPIYTELEPDQAAVIGDTLASVIKGA